MAINRQKMQAREDAEERGGIPALPGQFIPEPSKSYLLRFLPRNIDEYERNESDDVGYVAMFHFYGQSYEKRDGTMLQKIPCPKTLGMDRNCDICNEAYKLLDLKTEEDKKLAKTYFRTERGLLNLIDLTSAESIAKGVQWWEAPIKKVYGALKAYVLDPNWLVNGQDVLDIVQGRNFSIRVLDKKASGSGFVDYELKPAPQSMDVTPYLAPQADWRAKANELITHRPAITNTEIREIFGEHTTAGHPGTPPPPPTSGAPSTPPPPPPAGATPPPPPPANTAPAAPPPPPPAGATPPPPPPASTAPATPPPPPPAGATPPPPPAAAGVPAGAPPCLGQYSPRTEECKQCKATKKDIAEQCRKIYLGEA